MRRLEKFYFPSVEKKNVIKVFIIQINYINHKFIKNKFLWEGRLLYFKFEKH